jgi:hypothetical protein
MHVEVGKECLLVQLEIMHQILLRTWSNSLTNNPPMPQVLDLQSALSKIPYATSESDKMFLFVLADERLKP